MNLASSAIDGANFSRGELRIRSRYACKLGLSGEGSQPLCRLNGYGFTSTCVYMSLYCDAVLLISLPPVPLCAFGKITVRATCRNCALCDGHCPVWRDEKNLEGLCWTSQSGLTRLPGY